MNYTSKELSARRKETANDVLSLANWCDSLKSHETKYGRNSYLLELSDERINERVLDPKTLSYLCKDLINSQTGKFTAYKAKVDEYLNEELFNEAVKSLKEANVKFTIYNITRTDTDDNGNEVESTCNRIAYHKDIDKFVQNDFYAYARYASSNKELLLDSSILTERVNEWIKSRRKASKANK